MFSIMRTIAIALACLSWAGRGQRLQTSKPVQSSSAAGPLQTRKLNEQARANNELSQFATLLLSLNANAAFNPVSATFRAPGVFRTGIAEGSATLSRPPALAADRRNIGGHPARSGDVHMIFDRFNEKTIKSIMLAQEEARRLGHGYVGDEMIVVGVTAESTGVGAKVLKKFGVKLGEIRQALEEMVGRGSGQVAVEIPFNPAGKRVLEDCIEQMKKASSTSVDTSHMLLALIQDQDSNAVKLLKKLNVSIEKVREEVMSAISGESDDKQSLVGTASGSGSGRSSSSKTATLDKYGRDLNKMAAEGKIDPVIGREKQIERAIQILARKKKNNPVLIGEPGVGKTAIAEGLAQRIVDNDGIPKFLRDSRVIQLDLPGLLAGTKYRGEFEERFQNVLKEACQKDIILMIDEMHTIVGAGAGEGAVDAGNMLKPLLANGELQIMGSTTLEEYRKYVEKDKALERRFQPVTVPEPTLEESIAILKGLAYKYEEHHKLRYSREALEACVKLADQYITDRFLPDKAIDILDETGAFLRLEEEENAEGQTDEEREIASQVKAIQKKKEEAVDKQDFKAAAEFKKQAEELQSKLKGEGDDEDEEKVKTQVTETDVARVVAEWTGVPVEKVTSDESKRLLKLEGTLHDRVIGQDEAVTAVSKAVRRARAGLKNPARPIASFIFCGPTGVGKTELCKALSEAYFGRKEAMIRFDMSEFMERHEVSKLIGSPPGFVGYDDETQLCDKIRRNPYSLILFDEIEKAHPDVFNIMLQILEDGQLTDSKGRLCSFKNALIIMTSNVGAQGIEKAIAGGGQGFGFSGLDDEDEADKASYSRLKSVVTDNLKNSFKPEFINRLDDVIVFRSLTLKEIREIAELEFKKVFGRVEQQGIAIELTERFKKKVVDEGFDPKFGARPIRRAITRLMEDELSASFLSQPPTEGEIIILDLDDDEKVVIKREGKVTEGEAKISR